MSVRGCALRRKAKRLLSARVRASAPRRARETSTSIGNAVTYNPTMYLGQGDVIRFYSTHADYDAGRGSVAVICAPPLRIMATRQMVTAVYDYRVCGSRTVRECQCLAEEFHVEHLRASWQPAVTTRRAAAAMSRSPYGQRIAKRQRLTR